MDAYSWQLSGGLRQRAMIAMALSCKPRLLIADEPTTAIDVTTQAQILNLLRDLQRKHDTAIIFITHDLGVIAQIAHEVVVMYLGRVMEQGPGRRHLPRAQASLHARAAALDPEPRRRAARRRCRPSPAHLRTRSTGRRGCPFHPRCAEIMAGLCASACPQLRRSPASTAGELLPVPRSSEAR